MAMPIKSVTGHFQQTGCDECRPLPVTTAHTCLSAGALPGTCRAYHAGMSLHTRLQTLRQPCARLFVGVAAAVLLGGCAAGVGISVPLIPGVSLGVGVGSGGRAQVGIGTGVGPVGVGVGVDQDGRVSAGAGVGVSKEIGNSGARVGVGVGTSTTIHDPNKPAQAPASR